MPMAEQEKLDQCRQALQYSVRGEVLFDAMSLGLYSTDASIYQITPAAVVLPRDADDVRAVVEVAGRHGVAILPRGSGTSLNGQGVGPSIIVDFTKYMGNILELNVEEKWVRVQPGIVLDELNAELAKHGLQFAPDPATSSRATIGGMVGNNSSGTKSIIYGTTREHVLELEVLLSDGNTIRMGEMSGREYDNASREDSRQGKILSDLKQIIDENREEIDKRYPKVMRRVQGYNLDSFTDQTRCNLAQMIVGSEGTLGVVLQAKLNLEPLPKSKVLCVVHFTDLIESIRAVEPLLTHEPSAVEILNWDVISLAQKNLKLAPLCDFVQGSAGYSDRGVFRRYDG